MSAVQKLDLVSVEDYLNGELISPIKHEYLGGYVYAMAGARKLHNKIEGNTFAALHGRLRGKRCEPFNSNTKVRLHISSQVRFYYPDVLVVCRPNPLEDSFQDHVAVIVEVLSRSTRRIDEGEKKDAYLIIPSLGVYLLVEQEAPVVTVYRRTDQDFVREVYQGLDAVIPLGEIDVQLPLAEIYEAVEFRPEPSSDEEA